MLAATDCIPVVCLLVPRLYDELPLGLLDGDSDDADADGDDDDDDPVPVTARHQAMMPELRARPQQPSPTEARYLAAPLVHDPAATAGAGAAAASGAGSDNSDLPLRPSAFKAAYRSMASGGDRRALLSAVLERINQRMEQGLVQVRVEGKAAGISHRNEAESGQVCLSVLPLAAVANSL